MPRRIYRFLKATHRHRNSKASILARLVKGGAHTILVVDDEPSVRVLVRVTLESESFRILEASSGPEALEVVRREHPNLVLLDVMMSGLDGFEVCRRIKADPKTRATRVVMLTARGHAADLARGVAAGADDYFTKPHSPLALLAKVEDLLSADPAELRLHHMADTIRALEEENGVLRKRNHILKEQMASPVAPQAGNQIAPILDSYRIVCAALAHSLKSEFMHIAFSTTRIAQSASTSTTIEEELGAITRSVDYAELLLRKLLNFVDMGQLQLEPTSLDIVFRRLERLMKPRLPSTVRMDISATRLARRATLSVDSEQLLGVLAELVRNASRVLAQDGGLIQLHATQNNKYVTVTVKDNGHGIPTELRNKLLKEQLPSTRGLGLGLLLSDRVMFKMGGKLHCAASTSRGTTFNVTIPISSAKEQDHSGD